MKILLSLVIVFVAQTSAFAAKPVVNPISMGVCTIDNERNEFCYHHNAWTVLLNNDPVQCFVYEKAGMADAQLETQAIMDADKAAQALQSGGVCVYLGAKRNFENKK